MQHQDVFDKEGLRLEITSTAEPNAQALIKSKIKAYNDIHSPAHATLRKKGRHTLDFLVKDENDEILAGLLGTTYWRWLSIDELWVHESFRGMGYGRHLVERAEQESKIRDCTHSVVKTWSFQASGFYQKLGYQVVGQLEDYPPNETLYWLRKVIG